MLRIETARTFEELEPLRPAWERLPWQREEAAYEYFVTRLRTRADVIGPVAAIVFDGDTPTAGFAGRLESRALSTTLGYKVVYSPTVRLLRIVDGGLVPGAGEARRALLEAISGILRSGQAEAVAVPPCEVGSELEAELRALGSPIDRQPFIAPWTRRRLVLPETFEQFLASRSHKTRKGIRQDERRIEAAYGSRITTEIVRKAAGMEELVREADQVARSTYQRKLGGGFEDTPEQRALAAVGLEHGWVRGYLLRLDGAPIAYWLCSVYGETMLLRTGGYDEAHAEQRVGIYLLMRVIEDACADSAIRVLDFGPGDAGYKQQFSNESTVERNLVLFAPTFRARRINVTRTAILGPERLARRALDRTQLTGRLKSAWRRRLR